MPGMSGNPLGSRFPDSLARGLPALGGRSGIPGPPFWQGKMEAEVFLYGSLFFMLSMEVAETGSQRLAFIMAAYPSWGIFVNSPPWNLFEFKNLNAWKGVFGSCVLACFFVCCCPAMFLERNRWPGT